MLGYRGDFALIISGTAVSYRFLMGHGVMQGPLDTIPWTCQEPSWNALEEWWEQYAA